MKIFAAAIITVTLTTFAQANSPFSPDEWKRPDLNAAIKKCMWGETIGKAGDIEYAESMGISLVTALSNYCNNGYTFMCTGGGKPIQFCVDILRSYAQEAIDIELHRAGRK